MLIKEIRSIITTGILSIIPVLSAFSQTPEPVVARAYYTYEHQLDTTKPNKYTEDMLLALGKNASVFASLSRADQIADLEKQDEDQTKAWTGPGLPVIEVKISRYTTPTEIFNFSGEQKLFIKDFLGRSYIYQEDFPKINWILSSDTVTVSGIPCKKASATFMGRQWTVAYAPSLPFASGPWLLGGLPGLIVEAHDSQNQISYKLSGFQQVKPDAEKYKVQEFKLVNYAKITEISLPAERSKANNKVKITKVTKEDFLKLKAAMEKDPAAFVEAQTNLDNGVVYDGEAYYSYSRKPKTNNPLDREKK